MFFHPWPRLVVLARSMGCFSRGLLRSCRPKNLSAKVQPQRNAPNWMCGTATCSTSEATGFSPMGTMDLARSRLQH